MKNSLVSVVVPAYNAAKYIKETIQSVLSQSYKQIECIVVDDGSPDNLGQIVNELQKVDSRIQYYRKENGGVSIARNYGSERANGEYVLFLDSDDILESDFISSRVDFLENNIDYIACASNVLHIDENSNELGKFEKAVSEHHELYFFKPSTQTCPSSYLYKRSILDSHSIRFHSELFNTADRYFLHQVFNVGNIGHVDAINTSMRYRILGNSMSRKVSPKLVKDYQIYLKDVIRFELLPNIALKSYKSRFEYTIAAYLFHTGSRFNAIQYLIRSLINHPSTCFKLVLKKEK